MRITHKHWFQNGLDFRASAKNTCELQRILQEEEEEEIVPPSPTAPDDVLIY
jgi:hypothetical protein